MDKSDWRVIGAVCQLSIFGLALINPSAMFVGLIVYFSGDDYPFLPLHKASIVTAFFLYAAFVVARRVTNRWRE